jgi:hypothetical protein
MAAGKKKAATKKAAKPAGKDTTIVVTFKGTKAQADRVMSTLYESFDGRSLSVRELAKKGAVKIVDEAKLRKALLSDDLVMDNVWYSLESLELVDMVQQ